MNVLAGHHRREVEHRVDQVTFEDVAGHVFGRRHVFERGVGEDLARELRLGNLIQKTVLEIGIDLVRVTQPDLPIRQTGTMRELLVDELRRQDCRRLIA